jgi:pilus assembly protein Flp/PilA
MLDLIKIGFANLRNDRSAAGALEYALLCGLIAVVIITGVTAFGSKLNTFFTTLAASIPAG